jgi:hypothetical protein
MREPCPTCGGTNCAHQTELPLLSPAANLLEFRAIQKFTAACRQQWPGATIALRPNPEFAHPREATPDNPANLMTERQSNGRTE